MIMVILTYLFSFLQHKPCHIHHVAIVSLEANHFAVLDFVGEPPNQIAMTNNHNRGSVHRSHQIFEPRESLPYHVVRLGTARWIAVLHALPRFLQRSAKRPPTVLLLETAKVKRRKLLLELGHGRCCTVARIQHDFGRFGTDQDATRWRQSAAGGGSFAEPVATATLP